MKHIICYSGGHSSGIVALNVAAKFGTDDLILLNHNINPKKEDADIKRFKIELAAKIGVPITYANIQDLPESELPTQFDVCHEAGTITNQSGDAICTHRLKTEPFERYLRKHLYNTMFGENCVIYYGFDAAEMDRINRRKQILGAMGYASEFPLAFWKDLTYTSTGEVGVPPPGTYTVWKHANCKGCLKGGPLHWYVTYVNDYESFCEGEALEDEMDYALNRQIIAGQKYPLFLRQLRCVFEQMVIDNVPATEHQSPNKFFNLMKKKYGLDASNTVKPCQCTI